MTALAYDWVEHCSDIDGCETSSIQDKCSCLYTSLQLYLLYRNGLMECDEHVAVLNGCIVPLKNCNYRHLCMFSINVF